MTKTSVKRSLLEQVFARWYTRGLLVWFLGFAILEGYPLGMYLYAENRLETLPADLYLSVIMSGFSALVICIAVLAVRRWRKWSILTTLLATALSAMPIGDFGGRYIQLLPALKSLIPLPLGDYPVVFLLAYLVLVFAIAGWVGELVERLIGAKRAALSENLAGAVVIFMTIIFASQAAPALTSIIRLRAQASYRPANTLSASAPASIEAKPLPDIFYIVLDRYASNSVMKESLAYDNTPFLDSLRNRGFVVNETSHTPYPYTAPSIGATLDGNYLTGVISRFKDNQIQSTLPYFQTGYYGSALQELIKQGYHYDVVGSDYATSSRSPLAETSTYPTMQIEVLGRTKYIRNLEVEYFRNSPYFYLASMNLRLGSFALLSTAFDRSYHQQAEAQIAQLKAIAKKPAGGRLVFAHILVPHDPFTFNADGSENFNSKPDSTGADIQQKYLNQVKFINSQVTEFMETLDAQTNGEAIVALVSDEGPYPMDLLGKLSDSDTHDVITDSDMTKWPTDWLKMKFGNLYAVRIPKATPDAPDATLAPGNLNVFRNILNQRFGYTLEPLPNCSFGYPEGRAKSYVLADVTELLGQPADPRCATVHSATR